MTSGETADLRGAHDDIAALIATIPDAALAWQPSDGSWSLQHTIAHVARSYDLFVAILEAARDSGFGEARLRSNSPAWDRMVATDAAMLACATVPAVLDCLNAAYQNALAVLDSLTPAELDHPFVLVEWDADAQPVTTTLRRRVLRVAADHLREHQAQIADMLVRWRASEKGV